MTWYQTTYTAIGTHCKSRCQDPFTACTCILRIGHVHSLESEFCSLRITLSGRGKPVCISLRRMMLAHSTLGRAARPVHGPMQCSVHTSRQCRRSKNFCRATSEQETNTEEPESGGKPQVGFRWDGTLQVGKLQRYLAYRHHMNPLQEAFKAAWLAKLLGPLLCSVHPSHQWHSRHSAPA